jgi:hypothetical protein
MNVVFASCIYTQWLFVIAHIAWKTVGRVLHFALCPRELKILLKLNLECATLDSHSIVGVINAILPPEFEFLLRTFIYFVYFFLLTHVNVICTELDPEEGRYVA